MLLDLSQDIYEDTKNQYMTIDDVISERGTGTAPGVLDMSDSSGVSSEHDSTDSVNTTTTGQRFTRSQYRGATGTYWSLHLLLFCAVHVYICLDFNAILI